MTTAAVQRDRRRWGRVAVALAFLLGFLWELLGAVSNLLAWTSFAALVGRGLTSFAWIVLLVGLLIPPLAYVLGLVVGRRATAGRLALVLLAALCASEALTLSQLAFFQAGISS
jgi:hypothetical protein